MENLTLKKIKDYCAKNETELMVTSSKKELFNKYNGYDFNIVTRENFYKVLSFRGYNHQVVPNIIQSLINKSTKKQESIYEKETISFSFTDSGIEYLVARKSYNLGYRIYLMKK